MKALNNLVRSMPAVAMATLLLNCIPYKAPKIKLPGPNSVVLSYTQEIGSEAGIGVRRTAPGLVIYGDGRVAVGDPHGLWKVKTSRSSHVSTKVGRISPRRLADLLQFILITNNFHGMDTARVRAEQKKLGFKIADAGTTSLRVNTADKKHRVSVYALSWYKKYNIAEVRRLLAIQVRLDKLRTEIIRSNSP